MVVRRTRGEKVFDLIAAGVLILVCLSMLFPIFYVLSRSFMTDADRAMNPLAIFPHEWTLEGYKYIFSTNSLIFNSFKITLFRAIAGTMFSLLLESMFAYVISKKKYPLRNILTIMIAITMWFSGGLIPSFLLIRSLGFMDSLLVFIIPGAISVWNVLILRNFFSQIPDSIEESGMIDGANEAVVLFRLILPLSKAALATIALFHVVSNWNEWFTGILYITDQKKQPAMVILRQIISTANVSNLDMFGEGSVSRPPTYIIRMAMITVITFPIIVAYPFFQKYFTKGMMIGSIKG